MGYRGLRCNSPKLHNFQSFFFRAEKPKQIKQMRYIIVNRSIPVLPKITPFSPGSDAFYPGDYFSLQCSIIHGDLPISIFWKFNNQLLDSNDEIAIAKMGSRSSVLTIETIRDHHAGNYSCFGRNAAGTADHSVSLVVNGSLTLLVKCVTFVFIQFEIYR